eukprot:TRINITY_DN437_c1_g1_i11.p1 TRINITY_DN437_c1_g1~~TRINITY_DN437_c1_g1_i11.p1  ORF type:complete len:874 (-),score=123.61 TRINITY_DN437_c1_g1_i11:119-2740(-)
MNPDAGREYTLAELEAAGSSAPVNERTASARNLAWRTYKNFLLAFNLDPFDIDPATHQRKLPANRLAAFVAYMCNHENYAWNTCKNRFFMLISYVRRLEEQYQETILPKVAHLSDFLASAFQDIEIQQPNVKDPTSMDDVTHVTKTVDDGSFVIDRAVALLLLEFNSGCIPSTLSGIQYGDVRILPATEGSCGPTLRITYFKVKGDRKAAIVRTRKFAGGKPLHQREITLTCHADVLAPQFDVVVRTLLLMSCSGSISQSLHDLFFTKTEITFPDNVDYLLCVTHSVQGHHVPLLSSPIEDGGSHTHIADLFQRSGLDTTRYTAISNRKGHQTALLEKIVSAGQEELLDNGDRNSAVPNSAYRVLYSDRRSSNSLMHTGAVILTAMPKAVDTLVKVPTTFSELPESQKARLFNDAEYKQKRTAYKAKVRFAKDVLPEEQQPAWRQYCRKAGYDALVNEALEARRIYDNYASVQKSRLVEEEAARVRDTCKQNRTYQDPETFYKMPPPSTQAVLDPVTSGEHKLTSVGAGTTRDEECAQSFTATPPPSAQTVLAPTTSGQPKLGTAVSAATATRDASDSTTVSDVRDSAVSGASEASESATTSDVHETRPNPVTGGVRRVNDTARETSEPSLQEMQEEAISQETRAMAAIREYIEGAVCSHDHVLYNAPFDFVCFYERCDFKNSRPARMVDHLAKTHWKCNTAEPNRCSCPVCANGFVDTKQLMRHLKESTVAHHTSPKSVFNWVRCRAPNAGGALPVPQQQPFSGIPDGQLFMMCSAAGACFKDRPPLTDDGIGESLQHEDNFRNWKKTLRLSSLVFEDTRQADAKMRHQRECHKDKEPSRKRGELHCRYLQLAKGVLAELPAPPPTKRRKTV